MIVLELMLLSLFYVYVLDFSCGSSDYGITRSSKVSPCMLCANFIVSFVVVVVVHYLTLGLDRCQSNHGKTQYCGKPAPTIFHISK